MTKTSMWLVSIFALLATSANAQTKAPPLRHFDLVSGILFACGSATGYRWTGDACGNLSAEFKRRAADNKLPFTEVLITGDFSSKKREIVNGFDEDKAVRVFWNFVAAADGSITASIHATRIWLPTQQEMPGIAPGQRFALPFYRQQAILVPKATGAQAETYLKIISDSFFELGEKQVPR